LIYLFDLQEITPDNLLPEIKSLLGDVVGNIAKLAIVVLVEQKLGQVIYICFFPCMLYMKVCIYIDEWLCVFYIYLLTSE
jgi:hypothetical protein